MRYWIHVVIYLLWRLVSSRAHKEAKEALSSLFKHRNTEQLSHTSVYCKNVTASMEFYSLFGFEFINRRPDMGFPGAYMTFPNSPSNELHLISIGNKSNSDSSAATTDPDSVSLYGRAHIAVSVHSGMETVIESCRRLKLNILISAPRPGDLRSSLFIESPDGNVIEVSQANSEWIADTAHVDALADKAYNMLKDMSKQGNKIYTESMFNNTFFSRSRKTAEKTGAVAFGNPIATDVALKILKLGGSAADAAIAGNIAMCVIEPMNGGLGGDLFAMVADPEEDSVTGLNGSGSVPASYDVQGTLEAAKQKGSIPMQGVLSTNTVPGTAAWHAMHSRYGKLPWSSLFTESIQLAMHGFTITPHTRQNWNHLSRFIEAYRSGLLSQTVFSDLMSVYGSGFVGPLVGEKYRNPALGRTLMRIANFGSADFYTGLLSQELGRHLTTAGVQISQSDLASFYSHHNGVEWVKALSSTYRNRYELLAFPDNSQGIAALQILKILEGFDSRKLSNDPVMRLYCHLAAKRVVYIHERAVYGGDSMKVMDSHIQGLSYKNISRWIQRSFIKRLPFNPYELIPRRTNQKRELSLPTPADTVSYVVRDGNGMIVSGLQSLGGAFGSGIASPHHGFVMQNRGSGFAVRESMSAHPNALKAGRRPFHTLCPWIVKKKGRVLAALAVKGGDKQPIAFAQIMVNLIDRRMSAVEAVSEPRYRHVTTTDPTPTNLGAINNNVGDELQVIEVEAEYVLTDIQITDLLALGIKITRQMESNGRFEDSGFGIAQLIIVGPPSDGNRHVIAVTDGTRKPGKAEIVTV